MAVYFSIKCITIQITELAVSVSTLHVAFSHAYDIDDIFVNVCIIVYSFNFTALCSRRIARSDVLDECQCVCWPNLYWIISMFKIIRVCCSLLFVLFHLYIELYHRPRYCCSTTRIFCYAFKIDKGKDHAFYVDLFSEMCSNL